jgi:hypothetical protein
MVYSTRVAENPDSDDWKLNERVFMKLNQLWGPHTVDLFATAVNTQLPRYYTYEDSALAHCWSHENGWANPPWTSITAVIDKVIADRATITLVTPYIEGKAWTKKLKQLSIAQPVLLPHSHELFLPKHTGNRVGVGHPPWQATAAWRITGRFNVPSLGRYSKPDVHPKNLAEVDFSTGQLYTARPGDEPRSPAEPDTVASTTLREHLPHLVAESKGFPTTSQETRGAQLLRVHLQGHFGAKAMYKALLHDGWSWPNMLIDCQEQCKACPDCQRWTIGQHGYHPVAVISAELPFDHVAIDLAGPFTPSSVAGHVYLLVMVDVCTRFVFLRLLMDKSMQAVARQLVQIFCDVGFPKIVQSDNGKEFVNELMHHVCTESNIDHRLITPYHPRANGLAERFVQTSKDAIFKLLKGREQDWALYVPQVQLFINTKVAALHGSTPYSLMFGRKHNSFSDHSHAELDKMTHEDLDARVRVLTQLVYPAMKATKAINTAAKGLPTGQQDASEERVDTFPPGTYVMAKDELRTAKAQPRYLGPFLVIRRNRGGAYILKDAAGNALKRAPEALKQVTINREFGDSANVEKIMDHRGHRHEREYLVKWQGLDPSHNSWVKVKDFDDQAGIQNYWKKQNCTNPRA